MRTPAQTINRPAAAVSVRNKTKIKSNASSGLHFPEITLTSFFSFFLTRQENECISFFLPPPPSSSSFFFALTSHMMTSTRLARPVRGPTRCHGSTCLGVCFLRDQRQPITESPLSDPPISANIFYFIIFCSNFIILNGTIQITFLHWVKAIQGTGPLNTY